MDMKGLKSKVAATTAAAALSVGSVAGAQQDVPAPGTVTVPVQGGDVVVTPGSTTTTQVYVPPPGYPQPGAPDPNANLPSSSRPTMDTSRSSDGFDLGGRSKGTVVLGDKGGSAVLSERAVRVPAMHTVRRGDTLWDLSSHYYGNAYNWPKVWSFNPHIDNPHWIYPGDQVRMRRPGLGDRAGLTDDEGGGFTNRRSIVPENTVFLRSQGFIGDPKRDIWGELVGAREDQMLLSDGNHIYMIMRPGVDVRLGQKLTIFRTVRQPQTVKGARKPPGEIVAVKGTVRVDQWDPRSRVARGEIVESVDIIERGAKIGPVGRRLDVVPPRQNQVDLWARVLTSIYPHVYMAQNQVIFIDRGSQDGLEPGNRLFVVRKGDSWRRSLDTATQMARDRVLVDVPESVRIERTPLSGDEKKFPEEIIGELRVLRTEKYSSIAIVTVSHREIVAGDRAVARKGY
jgi:hypothetical protein